MDPWECEEWVELPEPPELVRAREKLAAYEARPSEEEPAELTEARRSMAQKGLLAEATAPWQPQVPEQREESSVVQDLEELD